MHDSGKYTKLFEVGDVIRPTGQQERVFNSYNYETPFVVTKSYSNDRRWLLQFKDANGRGTRDAGWYHYRFEKVYVGYDSKQTGDTDDDI